MLLCVTPAHVCGCRSHFCRGIASPIRPALAGCYDAAALGIAVSGDRAGQPTLRLVCSDTAGQSAAESSDQPVAEVSGFSLYAKHVVDGGDRRQVEKLCRYITRPPIAQWGCPLRLPAGFRRPCSLGLRAPRTSALKRRAAWGHPPKCHGPMRARRGSQESRRGCSLDRKARHGASAPASTSPGRARAVAASFRHLTCSEAPTLVQCCFVLTLGRGALLLAQSASLPLPRSQASDRSRPCGHT